MVGVLHIMVILILVPAEAGGAEGSGGPIMGLAYQPYVGQWSATADNPFAPGRLYTPAFNSYRGGISATEPHTGLWTARRQVALHFDREGRVSRIEAQGVLNLDLSALRDASASAWSRTYFKRFEGPTPQVAVSLDHRGSVYRQLAFLVREADGDTRIEQPGIDAFQAYFNASTSAAFLTEAFRWSRDTGVQIHAFEAIDEPHKSARNLPLAGLGLAESTLNHAGSYGAEGFYGIFRYTGVAGFSATSERPIRPGAKLVDPLRVDSEGTDPQWASQFTGQFQSKLPAFDFRGTAHAFVRGAPGPEPGRGD